MEFSNDDEEDGQAVLEAELARLKQEHRDLDAAIDALEKNVAGDQLQILDPGRSPSHLGSRV